MLGSLPLERYKAIIISLDVIGETELSFEKVKCLLLNDADRVADKIPLENANVAQGTKRIPGHCDKCRKPAHITRFCLDHKVSDDKKDSRFKGRKFNYKGKSGGSAGTPQSNVAFAWFAAEDSQKGGSWIVDSGA